MNPTYYHNNAIPRELFSGVRDEAISLPWCRPPSGIPGNRTPRNVAVLGDGSTVYKNSSSPSGTRLVMNRPFGKDVVYPLFQSSKDCSAHYKTRKLSPFICKLILHMRELVKKDYGDKAINVDNMFNIAICNFYTEKEHKINAHRDDERWLERNQLDKSGNPVASIIASLTIYPECNYGENPDYLRNFGIYDEDHKTWKDKDLENNSILFFSNHEHRCKGVPKRKKNVPRINITFRTLAPGLLGFVGYSNFYRYMSIPEQITFTEGKLNMDRVQLFINEAKNANEFNNKLLYSTDIKVNSACKENDKSIKLSSSEYNILPRYVKPLCSAENIRNYGKEQFKIRISVYSSH